MLISTADKCSHHLGPMQGQMCSLLFPKISHLKKWCPSGGCFRELTDLRAAGQAEGAGKSSGAIAEVCPE